MRPSVCRIVLYAPPVGRPFAAVITRVDEQLALLALPMHLFDDEGSFQVWLAIFAHTSTVQSLEFSDGPVPWSAEPRPGHWSWPPRV